MNKLGKSELLKEIQSAIVEEKLIVQLPYQAKFDPVIDRSFFWKNGRNSTGPIEYNVVIVRTSQQKDMVDVFVDYLSSYLQSQN